MYYFTPSLRLKNANVTQWVVLTQCLSYVTLICPWDDTFLKAPVFSKLIQRSEHKELGSLAVWTSLWVAHPTGMLTSPE